MMGNLINFRGLVNFRGEGGGGVTKRQSPGRRKFCLASGGCKLEQTRPWLGLVDLSRIPSGIFFREVHPGSDMAEMTKTRQNENENFQTMTNRDDS